MEAGGQEADMSVILVSSGYDHSIKFWEALSGMCSRTIQNGDAQVNRMAITPDKRYLAAACARSIRLYDIRSNNPNPTLVFEDHGTNVTAVAIQAEGKWLASSSEDGTVKVWDMRTGHVQRNYRHGCPVNDVAIHPNQGELISCDDDGNVRIWDLGEDKCTHQLVPNDKDPIPMRSVSVASDGSLLVAGDNKGYVYVWRLGNRREATVVQAVTKFRAHRKYITKVLLSPDVRHLATCSADSTARIWSTDRVSNGNGDNQEGSMSEGLDVDENGVILDSDGSPVEGGSDGGSAGAFELETTLKGHQYWVWDCAFSADSAYLVTASSDTFVRLWELGSGQIIRQYTGHHRGAISVALNDV